MDNQPKTSRGKFYHRIIYGLWSIMAAGFGLPAIAYLLLPSSRQSRSRWVDAGDISKIEENKPVEVSFLRLRADG